MELNNTNDGNNKNKSNNNKDYSRNLQHIRSTHIYYIYRNIHIRYPYYMYRKYNALSTHTYIKHLLA